MAQRILMIIPVPVPQEALDGFASQIPAALVRDDISIEFVCAPKGGRTLDSYYEGTVADFYCLQAGVKAEQDGYAAVCVNSMSDSGIAALRSRLNIPVIGTAQSAYLTACQVGQKFSIISMWGQWNWLYDKVLKEQGLEHRLASIRSIDVRPDTAELLEGKEDSIFPKLADAAHRAVHEDGADVLILGSTTMHQSHRFLAKEMSVPVINPGLVAFKVCEMFLDLGLSQSKIGYAPPEMMGEM